MGLELFDYQLLKNGNILIYWDGRYIMTLGGKRAAKLATQLEGADEDEIQERLRRITGNFKRGNER